MVKEILSLVLSATAIVAVLTFLGKIALELMSSSMLESFKMKLQNESELYKSNLSIVAKEHEIKFTNLQEERAKIIKELYVILVDFSDNVRAFVLLIQTKNEFNDQFRSQAAHKFYNLLNYFKYNEMYFNENFCNQFEEFMSEAAKINTSIQKVNLGESEESLNLLYDNFSRIVSERILPLKSKIQNEFRLLIGVI